MAGVPGESVQMCKDNKNLGRAWKGQISEVIKHSRYTGILSCMLELFL